MFTRAIKPTLALIAIATLAGCSHPVAPAQPPSTSTPVLRASEVSDAQRARELVTQKFTEKGTQVIGVTATKSATPNQYTFICRYQRVEFGQTCLYEAKGQVDIATADITAKRKLDFCLDSK